MNRPQANLVPMVVEQTAHGERAYVADGAA